MALVSPPGTTDVRHSAAAKKQALYSPPNQVLRQPQQDAEDHQLQVSATEHRTVRIVWDEEKGVARHLEV